jgi:ADP-heptose:LPS heptosyltransferase
MWQREHGLDAHSVDWFETPRSAGGARLTLLFPIGLDAKSFPPGTPLNAFFAWNEARVFRDRRYLVARDVDALVKGLEDGREIGLAHLITGPVIDRRSRGQIAMSERRLRKARGAISGASGSPAAAAAQQLIERLLASIGEAEVSAHAAVFQAFEELERHIDLTALAGLKPSRKIARAGSREILVIKLGALGDFIQVLGPMPEIRRHHADDRITLLTTARFAELAGQSRLFDDVIIDHRPKPLDLKGWLALRRALRRRRFDRVYDFQTSDRTWLYASFFLPSRMPEWSGVAWRCTHPHANLERDRQHTMDRQAEQLLMCGIYPASVTPWLPAAGLLPPAVAGRRFAVLIPGSSPRHLAKRWPATHYGRLAQLLYQADYLPVLVGVQDEAGLGRTILDLCPEAIDLIGQTDVAGLAALARAASLTVGNDTGATHVAAAGGKPVVVLFSRASDPSLCAPRGKIVRVLTEPNLADLPVEAVLSSCMAMAAAPVG